MNGAEGSAFVDTNTEDLNYGLRIFGVEVVNPFLKERR